MAVRLEGTDSIYGITCCETNHLREIIFELLFLAHVGLPSSVSCHKEPHDFLRRFSPAEFVLLSYMLLSPPLGIWFPLYLW